MRTCIFCKGKADSKEHLFPHWLDRDFEQLKGTAMPVTHRIDGVETSRPNWKIAHVEIKCVCRSCYSGWMGSLEGRVKPLLVEFIKGNTLSLSPDEQLELSAWATLKAFVYEVAANHRGVVTQHERDLLMSKLRAPANVRVFLAGLDDGKRFMVQRKVVAGYRTKESTDIEWAYATTFVVGHLVLQVLGSPTSSKHAFKQGPQIRPKWHTITPPVLPAAVWPSPLLLDESALNEFVGAFITTVDEPLDPSTLPPEEA